MKSAQKETLQQFYLSFKEGNAEGMNKLYHKNATFEDPTFGKLSAERVKAMWKMLLKSKTESQFEIEFQIVSNNKVTWVATYLYGPNKRKVTNKVTSIFEFKDELIYNQKDNFNLWNWTQQALGVSGYLLGWSNFMKNKIQAITNKKLNQFLNPRNNLK